MKISQQLGPLNFLGAVINQLPVNVTGVLKKRLHFTFIPYLKKNNTLPRAISWHKIKCKFNLCIKDKAVILHKRNDLN